MYRVSASCVPLIAGSSIGIAFIIVPLESDSLRVAHSTIWMLCALDCAVLWPYADPQASEPAKRDTMAVRVVHFIFSIMCLMCALTVGSVIPSAFPISLLVKP